MCKPTPTWHLAIRYILLITIGILLTLAYIKFTYVVSASPWGDLLLLRR